MSRTLNYCSMLTYFVLILAALIYWAPNFFMANIHLPMNWGYRYLAATGVPFALFLISLVARQSLNSTFSVALLFQFLVTAGLLWCTMYTFYYPPQSIFFASSHLMVAAFLFATNFYNYWRTLKLRAQYAGADD